MQVIEIQDATYKRLEANATGFGITPDMVINRALDALNPENETGEPQETSRNAFRALTGRRLPDLTHTKVLNARVASQDVSPKWNRLVNHLVRLAMDQLGTFEVLRQHYPANLVQGRKEDGGYRYLSDIDVSVQGMSANDACKVIVELARSLNVELDITFVWRNKDAAFKPGAKERILVTTS